MPRLQQSETRDRSYRCLAINIDDLTKSHLIHRCRPPPRGRLLFLGDTIMLARFDVAQRGDALDMLRSLPDSSGAVMVFDPQHRGVLDRLKFGNEGVRQIGRAALP